MRPTASRSLRGLASAAFVAFVLAATPARAHEHSAPAAPATPTTPANEVEHFLLLSTTDLMGKTGPCGCRVPAGGFARRAGYLDSLRALGTPMLVVENGGYFPDLADYEPNAAFMLDATALSGAQVVGLGDRELQFGRAFLLATLERAKVPVVCANLWDLTSKRRVAQPWTVVEVGPHKVGVFGLFSKTLGEARTGDSLAVGDPVEAAQAAVAALRKQGVAAIVLLSSLGKTETEDLVARVDGIDVAIAGRKVPLIDKGRRVKSTLVVYGGDQGHNVSRTEVGLDARGRVAGARTEAILLGPGTPEHPGVAALVKGFEESLSAHLRKLQSERAREGAPAGGNPEPGVPPGH